MTNYERLEKLVKQLLEHPTNACILAPGINNSSMRGAIYHPQYGNMTAAHASFTIQHGRPPDDRACHICDVPGCINPHHLFEGTHTDNMQDKVRKKRAYKQRFTVEQVKEMVILFKEGKHPKEVAEIFDAPIETISSIKYGWNWGWLTGAERGHSIGPRFGTKKHLYED